MGQSDRSFLTEIGQGGFGTTYAAADVASARTYVVKLARPGVDGGIPSRWVPLLPRLRKLAEHPWVLPIIDGGHTERGRPYLVTEQAVGGSLAERLAHGPLDIDHAIRIGIQLAAALEATHRLRLVHGDLKPSNVLFGAHGEALLADACIGSLSAGRTAPVDTYLASVEHLAPEVLAGAAVTPAGDQYALGSLLHTMVTGEPVFPLRRDEGLIDYARRVCTVELAPMQELDWPVDLAAILDRLLAKDPRNRFGTVQEVRQALQDISPAREGGPSTAPYPDAPAQGHETSSPPVPAAEGIDAHGDDWDDSDGIGDQQGDPIGPQFPEEDRPGRRTLVLASSAATAGFVLLGGFWLARSDEPATELPDQAEVDVDTTTTSTTSTTFVLPPLPEFPADFVPLTEPPAD